MRDNNREKDFFEDYNSSNLDKQRKTVITEHNSRSYQIDGMTNKSPFEIKMTGRDGVTKSIGQYFKEQYNITLVDKQPMLTVNQREGQTTYLPAQLCHNAHLPDNFTRNAAKMRDL